MHDNGSFSDNKHTGISSSVQDACFPAFYITIFAFFDILLFGVEPISMLYLRCPLPVRSVTLWMYSSVKDR